MPSGRMIGVGAFVIGGVLLFAAALFMIGERQNLFTRQFVVYAEFARLNGLQSGAAVQVSGMSAGEVTDIIIPGAPGGKFRLRLKIRDDLHQLVRADSIAAIRTEGLVGGQFVLVTAGSDQAPRAPDGSTIPSREPFSIGDLLDQASQTVRIVNDTIGTLRGDVEKAILVITATAQNADELITGAGGDIRAITRTGVKVATDVAALSEGVRQGRGTVGQLFADDELYRRATAIAADAEKTAVSLREATDRARQLLTDVSGKGGAAEGLTNEVRSTLTSARATLDNLAQNTEALKHNWFFSGYFKRRGYYSLAEVSTEDYRKGVLEQDGRTRQRVWLEASALFAFAAGGELTLADGAAAKLDAAMAEFLPLVGGVPFIIEGYAQGGELADRYVMSRRRAAVVRDYLVERFAINPDSIGVMPLGAEAAGSPSGNRWDGVAIAAFLSKDMMKKKK